MISKCSAVQVLASAILSGFEPFHNTYIQYVVIYIYKVIDWD